MDLKKMIKIKEKLNYSSVDIATRSGVPVSTVYKIFQGQTDNPRKETIEAIERALGMRQEDYSTDDQIDNSVNCFHEDTVYGRYVAGSSARKPTFSHKKQDEYTTEDLDNLPDDARVELIDGVIYDMAPPSSPHRIIQGELHGEFRNIIRSGKGKCVVISEPGVRIDCDNKTEVLPDVIILCDRGKLKKDRTYGAPDLIVEVLSPSNRTHDTVRKFKKYRDAGVREYWVVSPEEKIILVHLFGDNYRLQAYTFRDKVPVGIWDGKYSIDFALIDDYLRELFGEELFEDVE